MQRKEMQRKEETYTILYSLSPNAWEKSWNLNPFQKHLDRGGEPHSSGQALLARRCTSGILADGIVHQPSQIDLAQ